MGVIVKKISAIPLLRKLFSTKNIFFNNTINIKRVCLGSEVMNVDQLVSFFLSVLTSTGS